MWCGAWHAPPVSFFLLNVSSSYFYFSKKLNNKSESISKIGSPPATIWVARPPFFKKTSVIIIVNTYSTLLSTVTCDHCSTEQYWYPFSEGYTFFFYPYLVLTPLHFQKHYSTVRPNYNIFSLTKTREGPVQFICVKGGSKKQRILRSVGLKRGKSGTALSDWLWRNVVVAGESHCSVYLLFSFLPHDKLIRTKLIRAV